MTREEIFIQIISEVSGKEKQEIKELLNQFNEAHPGGKWDEQIPDKEAEVLIASLRSEGSGILAWLVRGAMAVARHEGHA
jgi:hypothetical protein